MLDCSVSLSNQFAVTSLPRRNASKYFHTSFLISCYRWDQEDPALYHNHFEFSVKWSTHSLPCLLTYKQVLHYRQPLNTGKTPTLRILYHIYTADSNIPPSSCHLAYNNRLAAQNLLQRISLDHTSSLSKFDPPEMRIITKSRTMSPPHVESSLYKEYTCGKQRYWSS